MIYPPNNEGALKYDAWEAAIPLDYAKRDFLLEGILHGFRVTTKEYDGPPIWENNYKSATEEPRRTLVESQIRTEIANGRYVMATEKPKIISALGAVDKPNSQKIRIIHDCSRPKGSALNDFAVNWKFSYQSVQDAISFITPGCFLAKVDLSNAYRSVKINPADFNVSGLAWTFSGEDSPRIMIDTRLMFGVDAHFTTLLLRNQLLMLLLPVENQKIV